MILESMTKEAKIVFDLSEISKVRIVCVRCKAEFAYPLGPSDEVISRLSLECPGCGYVWKEKIQCECDFLKLLRELVSDQRNDPLVHLRIEIDDPYRYNLIPVRDGG